jgi:4-amino-4-deoxy-L-arabinose transferase-like glycosyltransferase
LVKRQCDLILVSLLLVVITFVWMQERTRHFIGHHDWDNVYWVTAAVNYERYGLIDTRFGQILTPYETSRENWGYNLHHPPGISIITYIGWELFGQSEFTARLSTILASLLTLALLYALAKRLYAKQVALLSIFFFGFTPLMIYFSAKIGHEQFTLPLMLLALLIYQNWQRHPEKKQLLGLAFLALIGGFISWAWFLFLAGLGLHSLIYGKKQRVIALWPVWAGGIAGGVILLLMMIWQQPDFLAELKDAFLIRAANSEKDPITPATWLLMVAPRLLWLPTPVVTLFAIAGLRKIFFKKRAPSLENDSLFLIPALVAIVYCGIFWQATYIHDYLIYYLIASLAVWAAIGFWEILYAYGNPPKPTWRLIFYSMLGLFLIGSARWTTSLYEVDIIPERYEWGVAIRNATTSQEIIAVNLENEEPHVGYYAEREIHYKVLPEDIFENAQNNQWGFYIYCEEKGTPPPTWLTAYPYEYDLLGDDTDCYLVDLKP